LESEFLSIFFVNILLGVLQVIGIACLYLQSTWKYIE
jgi:hypothetical protein